MSLHRRGVLSIAGTILAGGCLGGAGTPTKNCSSAVLVGVEPFDPVAALSGRLSEHERAVLADAATGETPTLTTYRDGPFPEPTLATREEAFYRIRRRTVETADVPSFETTVSAGGDGTPGTDPIPHAALPEADRRALRVAVLGPGRDRLPSGELSIEGFPAPYPDGADSSRLIGTVSWVRWQDRTLRVEVAGGRTGTVERATYAVSAEKVADSPEAFRAFLAAEYLVDTEDFPESQRRIVDAAVDGGYSECFPESDALVALRDRLDDRTELPAPYGEAHRRNWYVEVGGERRLLSVSEGI